MEKFIGQDIESLKEWELFIKDNADSMEEDFKRAYNRNAPPNGHKLKKVKIFRIGSVTIPQELRIQLPPQDMKANMTPRNKIKKTRSNKRSIRIW